MAQPLREAIRTAIGQALEVRGCYDVFLERDCEMRASVSAAVDGSLEVVTSDEGPLRGFLRRKREPLDRNEMATLGFRHEREQIWTLAVAAGPGAPERTADAVERLFTGPFESSLDDDADLSLDWPGLVPGTAGPPPDAPHVEHLEATMAVFDLDPEADVLVGAGLPSTLHLQFSLAADDRVQVHVGGDDGAPPPPIDGYTDSPEIDGALFAEHDRATFPATAAALLHDHLGVGTGEPLFIYLSSDVVE